MKTNKTGQRKTIPLKVREILRAEVGFGCPIENCGVPYLEYHHFDPPVHIESHNNPEGMIALCPMHHGKADGGAYTVKQLHIFKTNRVNAENVKGKLEYLRNELLTILGGNFLYGTEKIVQIDGIDVVTLERDAEGYLRLSINLPSLVAEERIIIDKNSWENIGNPVDLRCPPLGRELEIRYKNGDYLYLRFSEFKNQEEISKKYLRDFNIFELSFPITTLEINLKIADTGIELTPEIANFGGVGMKGGFVRSKNGAILDIGLPWRQNPISPAHEINGNVIMVNFNKKK
ncbi:HNH endonuclease signature motif containing protein [Janthinobacterium sp. LS2A]|uniref:HNH endonuclease signature motif containing protein n=1 Tax=Janthinobacterium sp. LS2A TaxID=3118590 RepID=UPI002F955936